MGWLREIIFGKRKKLYCMKCKTNEATEPNYNGSEYYCYTCLFTKLSEEDLPVNPGRVERRLRLVKDE